jgi:hypothetical protein
MPTERSTVLLVGKTSGNAAELLDYLKRRGCVVRSAVSLEDAAALLKNRKFDLVLSDFLIADGAAYRLMPLLVGTKTSMFISNAVEDGCWWMNAIYDGEDRTKEPGMHPSEFKARLDNLLVDKLRDRTDRTLVAHDKIRSKITLHPTFVRSLLVICLACLAAFGIFLLGVFGRPQRHLSSSILSTSPRNQSSYQPKSAHQQMPTTHATKLRFYETEKEITI